LGLVSSGKIHFEEESHVAEKITNSIVGFYEEVGMQQNPDNQESCYSYGWSGLLNQHERRLAAIELYNRISVLYQEELSKGFVPRVRLVSHSHGGNVGLNLAAVHEVLEGKPVGGVAQKSLIAMTSAMNLLEEKTAENEWFYKPNKVFAFKIDEFVMYATPIQQETERFCFSSLFKKVFNIYSENDVVQPSDFISTSMRLSSRRIAVENYPEMDSSRLNQIQITVERPIISVDGKQKRNLTVKAALRGGSMYSYAPKDPAHADFWCVTWEKQDVFYDPLPLVVFTPIFIKILSPLVGYQDVTINITKKPGKNKGGADFMLADKAGELINSVVISLPFIKRMRDGLYQIQPKKSVYSFSFGRDNLS